MNEQLPSTTEEATAEPAGIRANGKVIGRLAAAAAASVLFFALVPPESVPLVMLVVGFVMLGLLFYCLLRLVLVLTGLYGRLRKLQRRAVMVLGVCLPLLLIVLQSLGQLTVRDTVTMGGLLIVGTFYMLRTGRGGR